MTKNSGIFYRGTAGKGQGTGLGALGNGVYLTWTEGMAKAFADRVGGEVKKYKVNAEIIDVMTEIRDIANPLAMNLNTVMIQCISMMTLNTRWLWSS